ncbi:hypothetical protein KP003_16820 [Geomonas nitrogeniifigens]|uniref:hypothetical protein n=1 Tax=Geomonas diazotrophica TaxID=2843197 RepID=UPI001C2C7D48|nr:hypothetical protein [Geomonas nitrogeniifigens]QXE86005.1 hypothetical protein KP003_16820 [Geomonas nitrogeniifigens]
MTCETCGGWQYCTVAEIDGKQRVVIKCTGCGKIQPITGQTPLITKPMLIERVACGRVF